MSEFEHDYYFPNKQKKRATVLCMRCAFPVITPEYSKEDVFRYYNEMPIEWESHEGAKVRGIIILCPTCKVMDLKEEDFPKIHRQIMKGLEDESKWANLPMPEALRDRKIIGQVKEAI